MSQGGPFGLDSQLLGALPIVDHFLRRMAGAAALRESRESGGARPELPSSRGQLVEFLV